MHIKQTLGALILALMLPGPAGATDPTPLPATHDELGRAFDELAGEIQWLGERFRGHFAPADSPLERPIVSIMLDHGKELGLTAAQTLALEKIRSDFQREAIKLDADQRVAQMDLANLLRVDPVDLTKVEAKVREIERLRGDLRLGRIRAVEQGKAQLTAEQRATLSTLLASPRLSWPWADVPARPSVPPAPPAPPQRF